MSVLLRMGIAFSMEGANSLYQRGWVYLNGSAIVSKWQVLRGGDVLSFVHNKATYFYFFQTHHIFNKVFRILNNAYVEFFFKNTEINLEPGLTRHYNNHLPLFFTQQQLTFFTPCFLTLTFYLNHLSWGRYINYQVQ